MIISDQQVFISHSSKDKEISGKICKLLENQGISCWIAPRDVTPGRDYSEEIITAIERSSAIILVFSENADKSQHVKSEIERAFSKGKTIFTIRISEVLPSKSLELHISSLHWIDAWDSPIEDKIDLLAKIIRTLSDDKKISKKQHDQPEKLQEKRMNESRLISMRMFYIILLIFTVFGISIWSYWWQKRTSTQSFIPPNLTVIENKQSSSKNQKEGLVNLDEDVKTKESLSGSAELKRSTKKMEIKYKDSKQKLPAFHVNYVYRSRGEGELKPINDGDTLLSGDHYKIIFTPDRESFVYIFQVDSAGQIFQLFPMESFNGVSVNNFNPVKKEKTYILPSTGKAFKLDKQAGLERIYFIVSSSRNKDIEELYQNVIAARKQGNQTMIFEVQEKLNKHFKTRGVARIVTDQYSQLHWDESNDVFSIIGKRFENLCEGCTHLVEFYHK